MNIIRDIHSDSKKQKVIDEFILNGQIEATILAEGIETMDEYEYIKNKNVSLMQWYLFGKPNEIPITKIELPEWK